MSMLNLYASALSAYTKRNEVINNNIANSDTPNFKRRYVSFEEYLNTASDKSNIKGYKTNSRHLDIPQNNQGQFHVVKDHSVSAREDGNNVNVDIEEGNLAKNFINYSAVSNELSSYLKNIQMAISGGRK